MTFLSRIPDFFCARPLRLKKDFAWSWRSIRSFLNQHRWYLLGALAVLSAIALAIHPFDTDWVRLIRRSGNRYLDLLSGAISHWGDFALYNLGLAFAIWTIGYVRRARFIQRLAIASLMGATLAGVTCNIFRFTMGRPRPKAKIEDRFHGIPGTVRGWNFQSFPSGHTSTAFGTATPLLLNGGPLGWAAAAFSSSVGWARVYGRQHYPTDVLIGAYLGIAFGVASGWPLLRLRRRLRRREKKRNAALHRSASVPASAVELFASDRIRRISWDRVRPLAFSLTGLRREPPPATRPSSNARH